MFVLHECLAVLGNLVRSAKFDGVKEERRQQLVCCPSLPHVSNFLMRSANCRKGTEMNTITNNQRVNILCLTQKLLAATATRNYNKDLKNSFVAVGQWLRQKSSAPMIVTHR
jgi:hypothetical protein